ncbi:caspase domain-containing protein [Schizophyllum amplum]|uniref:Caspase domain-containing protein n=1 Tax=Schizophyllum amplum TaxID=97359 RepID=A0A550C7Z2_9AGAR|nr:caspase domain-containing protein [Auriculariopsis ampla]
MPPSAKNLQDSERVIRRAVQALPRTLQALPRTARKLLAGIHIVRLLKRLVASRRRQGPTKRALLIGVRYGTWAPDHQLQNTHSDVRLMRELLIDEFGFGRENIKMMLDDDSVDPMLHPTHHNIMREIRTFSLRSLKGDKIVILYAGHGHELERKINDGAERDGMDQYIIPSDAPDVFFDADCAIDDKCMIKDDILYSFLVERLPPGCELAAFMDCCSSGTALDLYHDQCHNVDRFTSLVRRISRKARQALGTRQEAEKRGTGTYDFKVVNVPVRKSAYVPTSRCSGDCARVDGPVSKKAICISACHDSESTFEAKGISFTAAVVSALRANHSLSVEALARETQAIMDGYRRKLNLKAEKQYEKKRRHRKYFFGALHRDDDALISEPPPLLRRQTIQVSSNAPLDMSRVYVLQ